MASRRVLKKNVNYIFGELFTECLLVGAIAKTEQAKIDAVLSQILDLQNEFVSRISHTEPGNVKGFYRKFKSDFNTKIDEVIEAISALN